MSDASTRRKLNHWQPALVVCGDGLSLLPNFIIQGSDVVILIFFSVATNTYTQ